MSDTPKFSRRKLLTTIIGGAMVVSGGAIGAKTVYDATAPSEQDAALQSNAQDLARQWEEDAAQEVPQAPRMEQIPEPESYKNGETIGIMKIPAWGKDHAVPIISGTTQENLEHGVGHYDHSARAGQKGNFAVAGHRSGDPQPFRGLLELEVGDEVIVETKAATYTYVVTKDANQTTVLATDGGWAIVEPDVESESEYTMTLTTCTHLYLSPDRSILFADLKDVKHKTREVENP